MSCGLRLLTAPIECFDYCLYISDSKKVVKVYCHRAILLSHSILMRELITSENYFDLTVSVEFGYISSMLELLQFMYLKNTGLLSNREKLLELCAMLKMKSEFVTVGNIQSNVIDIESCQLSIEFEKLVSIKKIATNNEQGTEFNITMSSNGVKTSVNVQVDTIETKNHHTQNINSVSKCDTTCELSTTSNTPLYESEKINSKKTILQIHKRPLRSDMKRLRSTRNY